MYIKALRHICPLLDEPTANSLACNTIIFRLDYCNATLAGTTSHNIARLQQIHNQAAKVVRQVRRRYSSTAALEQLHWLPVEQRIKYKLALLTYKALLTGEPSYLRDLLVVYEPVRALRSSGSHQLVIPPSRTVLADRAFVHYAPKLWNSLPDFLRAMVPCFTNVSVVLSNDVDVNSLVNLFKRKLKAFLFAAAFNS